MDKNLPRLDFVGSKTPVADELQTPIVYLFWFFFQVALFLGENRTVIRWYLFLFVAWTLKCALAVNATLFSIAPLKVICNGELNPVDVTVTTTYTSTFSPWLGVLDHRKQLDRPSTFGLCRTTLHITKDLT